MGSETAAASRWAHVDLDSFFASVEVLSRPELSGLPVAVGSFGARGAVASANYPARAAGVRAGMSISEARRVCATLTVTGSHMEVYRTHSVAVMAVLERFGELTQVSIDEAFIDIAGVRDVLRWARDVRVAVHSETGLSVSVGAGTSRVVAKVASGEAKPDGIVAVPAGEEAAFLGPLPVRRLSGVGAVAERALAANQVHTVAELAALDETAASRILGAHGPRLVRAANGFDDGALRSAPAKSFGRFRTFDTDVAGVETVLDAIDDCFDAVARELAVGGFGARTVTVRLRAPNRTDVTRSVTSTAPLCDATALHGVVKEILRGSLSVTHGVRGAGFTVSNLEVSVQGDLFAAAPASEGLSVGERVVHRVFGDGELLWLSRDRTSGTVRFRDGHVRDFDLAVAQLEAAT